MEKELQDLLDNYERSLYGKEVLKRPTIYQLNLLLDYIANQGVQLKKQQEIIDKANSKIESMFANGDDEKILDDLLELSKILEVEDKEETDINVGEV